MKPSLPALKRANTKLQKLSKSRYLALLRMLCTQHGNSSYAQEILLLLKSERWADLLSYADSLSEQTYADATNHFVANQFASLIRKYPWVPSEVSTDPEGTALKKFLASEHTCKRVNQKFKLFSRLRSPQEDLISRVRGFIRYVLGDEPDMQRIYERCDYSGGASLGVHGSRTNLAAKIFASSWTVTPSAYVHYYNALAANPPLMRPLLEKRYMAVKPCIAQSVGIALEGEDEHSEIVCWDYSFKSFHAKAKVVTHNKIAFVPKTARTLRSIAVEPIGNGFLQKGIDLVLREKLLKVGLDLSDQSRNRLFAKFGSEDWLYPNGFCTIDLSSASDSIATEMCRAVLPEAWFNLFDQTRSKEYLLNKDSSAKRYEKFVSMGNGFCFPLETLLFAAITAASGAGIPRRDFVVYGDDIIVRKTHFKKVTDNLKFFGFKCNLAKTFDEGPFRESCGADWYAGEDVRPYTLDHALDSVENIFKFLNLSRRNQRSSEFFQGCYSYVLGWLPRQFQLFRPINGPDNTGIDLEGLEQFVSPLINLVRKDSVFKWYELQFNPVRDRTDYPEGIRIVSSLRGDTTLYLRRRRYVRVARKSGG